MMENEMRNQSRLYQNGGVDSSLWKWLPHQMHRVYRSYGCAATCAPILALSRVGISPNMTRVGLAMWEAIEKGIVRESNCSVTSWDALLKEMGCPTTQKSEYVELTDKINGLYITKLTSKTEYYLDDPKHPKSHFVVISWLDGEPVTLQDPWFGIHWYTEAFMKNRNSVNCKVLLN